MASKKFQNMALATLIATLLLILVGGLVRVSGSGLGCPDWPRCWGCWLPPTDVSKIDSIKYDISQYNPTKMWIEYANRMVGVVIGLLVLSTFLCSIRHRKSHPRLFWASMAAFALVAFQGWLGGEVVKSGLSPGIITLHMALAMALLTLLLWIAHAAGKPPAQVAGSERLRNLVSLLFVLTCLQVLLGTQVRESIDPHIKKEGTAEAIPRSEWLSHAGQADHVHRLFSWAVGAAALVLLAKARKLPKGSNPRLLAHIVLALVATQVLIGVTLAYLDLPPASQVAHLANSALLVCSIALLRLRCQPPPTVD